jgi:hypothetical protein
MLKTDHLDPLLLPVRNPDGSSRWLVEPHLLAMWSHLKWHRVASFALQCWRFASPPQTAKLKGETGQTVPLQVAQIVQAVRVNEPSGRAIWISYGEKQRIQMNRLQHSPDLPTESWKWWGDWKAIVANRTWNLNVRRLY